MRISLRHKTILAYAALLVSLLLSIFLVFQRYVDKKEVEFDCDEIFTVWQGGYIESHAPQSLSPIPSTEFVKVHAPQDFFKRMWQLSKFNSIAGETHPPGHYIVASLWYSTFGVEESSARVMPLIFIFLSLIFLVLFIKEDHGFFYALVACVLFLQSQHLIDNSAVARLHTQTLFLFIFTLYAESLHYKKQGFHYALSYSLGLLFGLYYSFMLWPALFVTFISAPWRWKKCPSKMIIPFVVLLVFFAPYLFTHGIDQLLNIPHSDFSNESTGRFQKIIAIFDPYVGVVRFFPFAGLLTSTSKYVTWLSYILLLTSCLYFSLKNKVKIQRETLFYFSLLTLPYFIDFFFNSDTSTWGGGRAVNYILIPLILLLTSYSLWFKKTYVSMVLVILSVLNFSFALDKATVNDAKPKASLNLLNQHLEISKGDHILVRLDQTTPLHLKRKVAHTVNDDSVDYLSLPQNTDLNLRVSTLEKAIKGNEYNKMILMNYSSGELSQISTEERKLSSLGFKLVQQGASFGHCGLFDAFQWSVWSEASGD